MPNGFCPALLKHITEAGMTDPNTKIPKLGFLQMILCCMDGSVQLADGQDAGHTRDLTVWYRDRVSLDNVTDTDPGCDTAFSRQRKELTLPAVHSQYAQEYFDLNEIRKYCSDASDPVSFGRTRVMRDIYDRILGLVAAVIRKVDADLVASMSTQFGVNLTTGTTAAKPIVYDPASAAGYTDIIRTILLDAEENELCDAPCIVGNGTITALELEKQIALGMNSAGLDIRALYNMLPRIFSDKNTKTSWGANQFGVFDKGSLALINAPQYVNNFDLDIANTKMFNYGFPAAEYQCPQDCLDAFDMDVRITEIDCPRTITLNGVATPVGPGYLVTVSKSYALFVKPGTVYAAGDPLAGVNGTFSYEVTAPVVPPAG